MYLTAQQAADELGISLATLYAYVSRGLLRSEESDGPSRAKRYIAADVAALKQKQAVRRNPRLAAEQALSWGDPVLESAITRIENGRFTYRGRDAVALAHSHSLEAVAGLIWHDALDGQPLIAQERPSLPPAWAVLAPHLPQLTPFEQFQLILPLAAAHDLAAYDRSPTGVARTGGRILHLLTAVATGGTAAPTVAAALQQAWLPHQPTAVHLLNAALVLCADHELNASSFTVRCVASTGANPYAAVGGGLAALQGHKHGGQSEQVGRLWAEMATSGARSAVTAALRRGEHIPGFGHPLYPQGDPRYKLLHDLAQQAAPTAALWPPVAELTTAVQEALGLLPTIDLGLVLVSHALGLPPTAPQTLFALGRVVGWVGHMLEQYTADTLIRPRARYVGR